MAGGARGLILTQTPPAGGWPPAPARARGGKYPLPPPMANKAFLIHQSVGRGQLVAFAEDPNYRAYAEATQLLFMNAVLLGPGR